ncbi:TOBE domain-containing protein [Pectobacterium versatile]|uniref:TOBE domain-containing protein n=1 Tax=Pectobacterium versatile TaxID=2488639 RepID=A0A855MDK0_9GAMM|nr:TOBE domain-containing protein [Pectobacterium versatile]GKV81380.1 transporter [Pectobacterium carotovorum subsp. carotovorum]MBA0183683.1 TOBE domain-containing protein [Pectobacterium versatile]MBN3196340.1 TOBE domain-containing protein [Pectobacterium versatile]MBQ4793642.1 transporter [Pectobacterium versatile]MCA5932113.1 TOBE domain-containing protein [Pectobacterium versatile]
MSVSARNQLSGIVSSIVEGAVNNEVELTLESGDKLTTVITRTSCDSMELAVGKPAIALVKAPWVILASAECGLNFSARNQFHGKVSTVAKGAVNSTVQLVTACGLTLTSTVTNESLEDMHIDVGSELIALVKASSIILATRK